VGGAFTVHVRSAGVGSVLPPASVASTRNVCEPDPSPEYAVGELHAANTTPSMLHWNVAGSDAVNVKVADVELTVPEGPEVMVVSGGDGVPVKVPPLVVPRGVVTETGPLVAPAGTWAVISVGELTTKLGSAVPLNVTEVAPVKLPPMMSTVVPAGPL